MVGLFNRVLTCSTRSGALLVFPVPTVARSVPDHASSPVGNQGSPSGGGKHHGSATHAGQASRENSYFRSRCSDRGCNCGAGSCRTPVGYGPIQVASPAGAVGLPRHRAAPHREAQSPRRSPALDPSHHPGRYHREQESNPADEKAVAESHRVGLRVDHPVEKVQGAGCLEVLGETPLR